ncbi:universal stress protein [Streptomyces sp. NEAU-Y11]|uniref:universal stress protein n=1 Tax=Streptomyces cucumeris TaxID=2962890 RepID=UPI0020C8D295|nr:universal stress protein [Streptomyces sp. NEAU-Y11]MCP9207652.1 universal stress protein [Streptomyces sp. NEAU-Y11]
MRPPITVGIDGFPESPPAAHWAAREALLRDVALRLVHAWILLAPTDPDVTSGEDIPRGDDQNYWARRLLSDTVGELRAAHPELRVTAELVPQETVPALLAAGRDAEMLVLGSRGRGTIGGFLLGSTGRQTLARGTRPMVLVHADDGGRNADVTVGLGLRRASDEVLEFAFDAAARRGGSLRAVHAGAHRADPDATAALSAALLPWRDKYPRVPVAEEITSERAGRGVVRAAAGSGLLVLGRDGAGHGGGPRLGAVTHAAVHHAPCPVAVVPCG